MNSQHFVIPGISRMVKWSLVVTAALLIALMARGPAESAPFAQGEGRAVFALGFEDSPEGSEEDAPANLVLAVVQSTQPVVVAAFANAGAGQPPDDSIPSDGASEVSGVTPDDNVPAPGGGAGLVFYEARAGDALNLPQFQNNVFDMPIFEILENPDALPDFAGAELLAAGRLFAQDDEARSHFQANSFVDPTQAFNEAVAKAVGNLAGGFNFQGPPPVGEPGAPPPPFFLPPELADIFGNQGALAEGVANFLPIIVGPPFQGGGGAVHHRCLRTSSACSREARTAPWGLATPTARHRSLTRASSL